MNLIRLITIGLIVWLLYRMLMRVLNKSDEQRRVPPRGIARDMVKCSHCGIHIPVDEAVCKDGVCYCSAEHRDAGPNNGGQ
jgi:uncharacterized protein